MVIYIDNIDEIIFMFIEHGSERDGERERDENCSEHDAMGNIFTEVKQKSIFKIAQKSFFSRFSIHHKALVSIS